MANKTLDEVLLSVYKKYYSAFQKLLAERGNERDVRVKHFDLFAGDLAEHISIIKAINLLATKYPKDLEKATELSNDDVQFLLDSFQSTIMADCFLKLIMRTELLFRTLYSALNPGIDVSRAKMHPIIAALTGDTQSNWQKEDSKLLVMLWDARNSIHTSGVYSNASKTHTYKGQTFNFVKEMRGVPFTNEELVYIMEEVCDVVDGIVHSPAIVALPYMDHPFYKVFGK